MARQQREYCRVYFYFIIKRKRGVGVIGRNWRQTTFILPLVEPSVKFCWTAYLVYRAELRGFDISILEQILRYSEEKYFDTATRRMVAVGKHRCDLVMIPYDITDDLTVTPITVHATTRQQVAYRIKSGRFKN